MANANFDVTPSEGLIRRIDDLGRIVIPKELRRQLRISEGDPISIMLKTMEDGKMCIVMMPFTTTTPVGALRVCLRDIAQFVPDTMLLAAFPKWNKPIFTAGTGLSKGGRSLKELGSSFPGQTILPGDVYFAFREVSGTEFATVKISTVKPACYFTGKRLKDTSGVEHLIIGVFHADKELDTLYRNNLAVGIEVFLGQERRYSDEF